MILLAGGTGRLGTQVVRLLAARGFSVRILTRDPEHAKVLEGDRMEVQIGDVRDPGSLDRAVSGIKTVISAITGFPGFGGGSPRTVDWAGNRNLIRAARRAGVDHFILVSIIGAGPKHPMELARMKYRAEQELTRSGLAWTILRPTAYMETWTELLGDSILRRGKATVFGRGLNPINFVSAHDVARYVELAVVDPGLRSAVVNVGGPENLSLTQFVRILEATTGKRAVERRVPPLVLRLMSVVMRFVKPPLARLAEAALAMDTMDMSFDFKGIGQHYPAIPRARLLDVLGERSSEAIPTAAPTVRD